MHFRAGVKPPLIRYAYEDTQVVNSKEQMIMYKDGYIRSWRALVYAYRDGSLERLSRQRSYDVAAIARCFSRTCEICSIELISNISNLSSPTIAGVFYSGRCITKNLIDQKYSTFFGLLVPRRNQLEPVHV